MLPLVLLSLLQLLRAYADNQDNWERYLPLVLYAYHTAVHSSTGSPPFLLMLGRYLTITPFSPYTAFDSTSYPAHIHAKFAELHDFMESNLATAAHHQKLAYDQHSLPTIYSVGDLVWLSIPTARKLDPRWEGRWKIKLIKSPVNKEIKDGLQTKIVHINRSRHHI